MSTAKTRAPINDRVRLLVDVHDKGSVNAAAQRTGIAQATLARLADGRTQRPRSDLVRDVAKGFGISTDWLLNGIGQGPPGLDDAVEDRPGNQLPQADLVKFYAAIQRFEVSDSVRGWLASLPTASRNACFYSGMDTHPSDPDRELVREIVRGEYRLWTGWLETLEELKGTKEAAKWLEANVDLIEGGFRLRANVVTKQKRDRKPIAAKRSSGKRGS